MKWPSADVEHIDTVVCEMENALKRSHWSWVVDWVFRIANNIMKTASASQFSVSRKERKMDLFCLCQVTQFYVVHFNFSLHTDYLYRTLSEALAKRTQNNMYACKKYHLLKKEN